MSAGGFAIIPALADERPAAELLLFEDAVVTGAAKHPQAAHEAPAWVTVISRDDIQRFGYRTLAEAIRAAAIGFYSSYDRLYESLGVRGFLRPEAFNDRILLLVNGHTYNNDVFQQAYLGNDFGIDMEAVDHIEVIRGPGSALYGGSALFAVINVVTVAPADAPTVLTVAETGSFGRKRGRIGAGHVFQNGLGVYGSASILDVDGNEDLFFPELDTPQTNHGIAHKQDEERAYHAFLSAQYKDLSFQAGYSERNKQVPTGFYGVDFNDPRNRVIDWRSFAEAKLERPIRPDVSLMARAYYDGFSYDGNYVYSGVNNRDLAQSYWLGGETAARWDVFAGNTLTVGGEIAYHPSARQKNASRETGQVFLDDEQAYDNWGVYLQDEWAVLPSLDIVAGLRYDRYYDRIEEFSPRGAVIWRPVQGTTLKLLVGQAFRPPNLYEQFYALPLGDPGLLANPSLKSELMTTYEGVVQQALPFGATGLVSGYHYDIDNLIDNLTVPCTLPTTCTQFQNLSHVQANGLEAESHIPLRDWFTLRAGYAYQEAESGGKILTNSPHHLGQIAAAFTLPWAVQFGVDMWAVGPRETQGGLQVPTAYPVDLTVRLPELRGVRLSGSLYNLLDQHYADPGTTSTPEDRIPQDGRVWRLRLTYVF